MGTPSRLLRTRLPAAPPEGDVRERVCAGLVGDVVEIGYGAGLNHPHLPPEVTGVWAIEPSPAALHRAGTGRGDPAVPVVVAGADAQRLPFPDDRFDSALSTWVLCGLPDPAAALAEVARVLRPGGVLHFVEHGRSPDPAVRRWQRRGPRAERLRTACSLDDDVAALLAASPLTVTELVRYDEPGQPSWAGYTFEGRATAQLANRSR
ncbi:class I SAM-dependent methyltransferase [Trujillonella humicola]|uniref:class I SAM-dependent methyltransferase n=1 Tax=Trujillonella humicola TaxID=3383699 RepID=UPI003906027D